MKTLFIAAAALGLVLAAGPSIAAGNKTGFSTTSTQGSSGKTNTSANPANQGQTIVSGPNGQVKQGKTANTTTTGPGNSTKMP